MSVECLRKMGERDLGLIRSWRNHPNIRRYMYSQHEISLQEHRRWFEEASTNPAKELLIFEHQGAPSGFVCITFRALPGAVAEWGFYLAPDAPPGAGTEMGEAALIYSFSKLKIHKLCGEAIEYNDRSIRFHDRLGFRVEGRLRDQFYDGERYYDVVCFGLLHSEWQQRSGGVS